MDKIAVVLVFLLLTGFTSPTPDLTGIWTITSFQGQCPSYNPDSNNDIYISMTSENFYLYEVFSGWGYPVEYTAYTQVVLNSFPPWCFSALLPSLDVQVGVIVNLDNNGSASIWSEASDTDNSDACIYTMEKTNRTLLDMNGTWTSYGESDCGVASSYVNLTQVGAIVTFTSPWSNMEESFYIWTDNQLYLLDQDEDFLTTKSPVENNTFTLYTADFCTYKFVKGVQPLYSAGLWSGYSTTIFLAILFILL